MGGLKGPPGGKVVVHPVVYADEPKTRRKYEELITSAKKEAEGKLEELENQLKELKRVHLNLQAEYHIVHTDRERLRGQAGKPSEPLTRPFQGSDAEARLKAQVERLKEELAAVSAQASGLRKQLAAVPSEIPKLELVESPLREPIVTHSVPVEVEKPIRRGPIAALIALSAALGVVAGTQMGLERRQPETPPMATAKPSPVPSARPSLNVKGMKHAR